MTTLVQQIRLQRATAPAVQRGVDPDTYLLPLITLSPEQPR
jgi:hypothetical protein